MRIQIPQPHIINNSIINEWVPIDWNLYIKFFRGIAGIGDLMWIWNVVFFHDFEDD